MDRRDLLSNLWRGGSLDAPSGPESRWPARLQVRLAWTRPATGMLLAIVVSVALAVLDIGHTRTPHLTLPIVSIGLFLSLGDKLCGKGIPEPAWSSLPRRTRWVEYGWAVALAAPWVAIQVIGSRGDVAAWGIGWAVLLVAALVIRPALSWPDYLAAGARTKQKADDDGDVLNVPAMVVLGVAGVVFLVGEWFVVVDVYDFSRGDRWFAMLLGIGLVGFGLVSIVVRYRREQRACRRKSTVV